MSDLEYNAARMEEFLKDEVVMEAFRLMRDQTYRNFLLAETNDDRLMAQAQAKVLDTLAAALRSVVDAGERARIDRERSDRFPDSRQ